GRCTCRGASLRVDGPLMVGPNGTIHGNGTLAAGNHVLNGGVIEPGLSPGVITIEGDYEQMPAGLLEIQVAGLGPDQFDVLRGTRNAAVGGELEVNFRDGFLPKAGDAVDFLQVGGSLDGTFHDVRVGGVADDFLFDVARSAGGLRLTARSDARPAPCADGQDDDGDGLVDCADPGCAGSPECTVPHGGICGNCVDDDGNGLTAFEEPACRGGAPPQALRVRGGAIKRHGSASALGLALSFQGPGDPSREDLFLQLAPDGAAPALCARIPAARLKHKGKRFMFTDHGHAVISARGLDGVVVRPTK